MPSFAVNCIGHQGQHSYTEYLFRVRHSSGCEWIVSRRYQELMDLHERLCAVFGDKDLPPFPPRTSGSMVGVLFGHRPGSQPEVVKERERGFQRYFDGLCDRQDVVGTACFQTALAVAAPEPISHLRVQGWLPPTVAGQGLTALLDIRPEALAANSCAVAEAYHVRALLVFGEEASEKEELCPVSDVRQPALGRATLARVEGLKPEAQVEFEVSAANAVGRSAPVAIRAMVPPQASVEAPRAAPQAAAAAAGASPQAPAEAPAADSQWLAAEQLRIQQEREKLERWWADRQREAERADAAREEEMAAFRAQREAFNRQRSPSGSASPDAASPADSPRRAASKESPPSKERSPLEVKELLSLEERLQRREEDLASREALVGKTESQLHEERQELVRAKGKLAVVQAHVVSMIESQQTRGTQHRIDDGITPHHASNADSEEIDRCASGSIDGVWNMDWVSAFKDKTPKAGGGENPSEEDSPQRTPGAAADGAMAPAAPPPQAVAATAAAGN